MDPERSEAPAEDVPSTDPVALGPPRTGSPFEPIRLGSILGPNRPAFRFGRHKPTEVRQPEEIPRETVVPAEPVDPAPAEAGAATPPSEAPVERSAGVDVLDLLGVAGAGAAPISMSEADPIDEPEVVAEPECVDEDASGRPVDAAVVLDEVVVADHGRPADLVDEPDPVEIDDTATVLDPDAALETVADDSDDADASSERAIVDPVDGEAGVADEERDRADRRQAAFEVPDEDVAPGVAGLDDRSVTESRASRSEWPSADDAIAPENHARPPSDDAQTTPEVHVPAVEFEDEPEPPLVDLDLAIVDPVSVGLLSEEPADVGLDSVEPADEDLVPVEPADEDLDSVDLLGDEPALDGSAPSVVSDAGPPAIEAGPGDDAELVLEVAAHRPVMVDRRPAEEVEAPNTGIESLDADSSAGVESLDADSSAEVESTDVERSADVESPDADSSAEVESLDADSSVDVESMDTAPSTDVELSSDDEPRLPTMDDLRSMADELDEVDAILARLDADPDGLEALEDSSRGQVADLASAE